jgi:hypothetical protein
MLRLGSISVRAARESDRFEDFPGRRKYIAPLASGKQASDMLEPIVLQAGAVSVSFRNATTC